jgi:hypothetical protein
MIKDYYLTLKISRNASEEEIKKAYRRLALKHHPDRSRDQNSKSIILEINEAYEVLGDPHKRDIYNLKFDYRNQPVAGQPLKNTSGPTHAPIKKKTGPRKVRRKKFDYTRYARNGKLVAAYILFFCVLLSLDYCFSTTYKPSIVQSVEVVIHRTRKRIEYYTFNIESTKVNVSTNSSNGSIQSGDTLEIDVTPIFGIVKHIRDTQGNDLLNIINIFMPFYFLVLAGMGTALAAILKKSAEQSFSFSLFLFILVIYFTYLL